MAATTSAILRITNGTDTVNLLASRSGFHLRDWSPAIAGYKDGGVVLSSTISEAKAIAMRTWDYVTESFTLAANFSSPDIMARELRRLRLLLRQAESFFDLNDYENEPVWIEARAAGETNMRYAYIFRGQLTNESNHYNQPFIQRSGRGSVHDGLILAVERTHWTNLRPYSTPDSLGLTGYISEGDIVVSNSYVPQDFNLFSRVYYFDGVEVVGGNLAESTTFTISNLSADEGDSWIAFGANWPFPSITLTISPVYAGPSFDYVIETLFTQDEGGSGNGIVIGSGTVNNGAAGQMTFLLADKPELSTWGFPGEDTGRPAPQYWARIRRTTGGNPGPPNLMNGIFPATTSSFIPATVIVPGSSLVGGELEAAIKVAVREGTELGASNLIISSRRASRGEDFRAFINLSDNPDHNDGIISVTAEGTIGAGSSIFTNDEGSAVGRSVWYSIFGWPGAVSVRVASIKIDSSVISQWVGSYRMFLRFSRVDFGGGQQPYIFVRTVYDETAANFTDTQRVPLHFVDFGFSGFVYDLGYVDIMNPQEMMPSEVASVDGGVTLEVWFFNQTLNQNGQYNITDLILMPADELFVEAERASGTEGIVVDAIGDPRNPLRSYSVKWDTGGYLSPAVTRTPGMLALAPDIEHKLFFFWRSEREEDGVKIGRSFPQTTSRVRAWYQHRYYSLRGDA